MMSPLSVGIGGILVLLVLLALGIHIAVALLVSGFLGMVVLLGFEPAAWSATSSVFARVYDFKLITVPLFVLMGFLAAGGGVADRLYDAAALWTGKFRAGLGIATIFGCTGFGAVSGSSLVTASVFAKISAPQMRIHGYRKELAYGICAAGGMIGMLIPPSVLIVVYSIVSGESIGKLLIGGIAPGLLLTALFSIGLVVIARIRPTWVGSSVPQGQVTWRKRFSSIPPVWPIALSAAIIFGGIFGGVFSPTESASIAAFTMILVTFWLKRRDALHQIAASLVDTALVTAMIFAIMIGAYVFTNFLTLSGVTRSVVNAILGLSIAPSTLIILITILYLVLGCFLDSTSMVVVTVPILHPAIVALGIDPIWYALVIIMAMEIGLLTPPVGLNVYGTQAAAEKDVSIEDVFRGSTPFFLLALLAMILMIAFPAISTTLPSLMILK